MNQRLPSNCANAVAWLPLLAGVIASSAHADWQRDDTSLGWRVGSNTVWQFGFDPNKGKPYFHPVSAGGTAFTNFRPGDHLWHYGLWFSWKYINQVNYWEENPDTGKAEGSTRWQPPAIETKPDGSALINLKVTYTHTSGRVEMTEDRLLTISAPRTDGSYTIDWRANFKAGKEGAVLDRTAMPGEPDGKVNGGYAGLGLRVAGPPLDCSVLCSTGQVNQFVSDRARLWAPAIAFNFAEGARDIGGIAIFSDPINAGENAPWYVVNSQEMRFACAAILAPKFRMLKAGEEMKLHYRISIRPKAWTPESLQSATP